MKRIGIPLVYALLAIMAGQASAQTQSARCMGMGGVSLGGSAKNVAYRAVPAARWRASGFSLPIGLIPLISDPPVTDSNDSLFNAFELVNLVQNPPWNLQLNPPPAPSNDVVVSIGRNELQLDLGDIRNSLPRDGDHISSMGTTPALAFGFRQWFAGVALVTQVENEFGFNDPLQRALIDGEPFTPNTHYALVDSGQGQVLGAIETGMALPLAKRGDPRGPDGFGFYGGARATILRGLAYGQTSNRVGFTTQDTLFSSAPIELDYQGDMLSAGPSGGGWGLGVDVGAVLLAGGCEFGVGANHLGARVHWEGTRKQSVRDSVTGSYQNVTVDDHASFTSTLPVELCANVVRPVLGTLLAADATYAQGVTEGHLGLERWLGCVALRAGGRIDARGALQGSAGTGVRMGRFGLDAAVASHGRSFGTTRGLELGVGLSLYH